MEHTKFDEQKSYSQDKAVAKASGPPQAAETAGPTPPVTTTSASTSIMAVASAKLKEEGGQQIKQNEKKGDAVEVVAIESDVESNWGLMIDEHPEEILKQSTGPEQAMQSASGDRSTTLFARGL